ncbi:MAG: hypothetical protein AAF480_01970 [Actinomycetota bacterium]
MTDRPIDRWGDPLGGGDDLTAALHRFASEAQVGEAAASRARQHWLEQQAAEETTFAGVLADLAERGRPVLVHTTAGRRHRGVLRVQGSDFVSISTDVGGDVLVALGAVTSVRSQPRDGAAHSGRAVNLALTFAGAVAALAEDRPRVAVATSSEATVNGELRSVGQDVVTIRVDGDTRANVYVPLDAVTDVSVAFG